MQAASLGCRALEFCATLKNLDYLRIMVKLQMTSGRLRPFKAAALVRMMEEKVMGKDCTKWKLKVLVNHMDHGRGNHTYTFEPRITNKRKRDE